MDLSELTNEKLEEQIETYEDRIETMSDYISDEDDSTTRGVMQGQLQRYRMAFQLLKTEKQNRRTSTLEKPSIDLTEFVFKSSDHLRHQNGVHVSGPHGGAGRVVKVESNINGGSGFSVTMYNSDGDHPVWQNNIQMEPKQMKIIQSNNEKIVFRGFGRDMMGDDFSDYGLTILLREGNAEKCILHMHNRNVDIEYLK